MKRKWWIVGVLVLLELLVCATILLTLWAGRSAFGGMRFFYVANIHVEETLEETLVVDGPATLDVETVSGDVTVTGGAGNENEVQVIARLDLWGESEEDARRQLEVKTTQDGNRITIRVVRPESVYFIASTRGSRVNFEIRVPAETSLRLTSSSGDLEARAVTGTVELQTTSGNIRAEEVNGAVRAQSSSGDVTLAGLSDAGDVEAGTISGDVVLRDVAADSLTISSSSGRIQVERGALSDGLVLETTSGDVTVVGIHATAYQLASSSGDLTLDGCGGPLALRTISGRIEVRNSTGAELALETSSGKVIFSGSLHDWGENRVETVSGDVRLVLPAGAAFDLDIETVAGDIQTDFAVTMTQFGQRRVVGEVNGGGPSLRISTSSGNVALKQAPGESE